MQRIELEILATPPLGAVIDLPESPVAAALIHQGSGIQDRDGNMKAINFRSSLYKRLGRELAGREIAVLRFDKRESDSSGEHGFSYTVDSRIEDARAALQILREQERFAGLPIFLVGHSEGGMILAKLAETEKVDGVVSLAAPIGNTIELGRFRAQRLADAGRPKGERALDYYDRLEAFFKEGAKVLPEEFKKFATPYLGAGYHGFDSYEWLAQHWANALESDPTENGNRMLVVQGGSDARMYPDNPQRWQMWCDQRELAECVTIEHMGHDLNDARKKAFRLDEELVEIVATWVKKSPRPSAGGGA